MATEKHQCSVQVPDSKGYYYYPCSRKATIERDGKWYCAIHDPEYIKVKQEKSHAKYEAEMAKFHRDRLATELTKDLTLAEIESLTPDKVKASNLMYEALKVSQDALKALIYQHPDDEIAKTQMEVINQALGKADGGK